MVVERCEERRVRPAEAERHPEALARAHRDVGTEPTRRFEDGEGEEVGGHDQKGAAGGTPAGDGLQIRDRSGRVRVLDQHSAGDLGIE